MVWHGGSVTREQREQLLQQRGCVVWMTGLSASGKSTVARALEERLVELGHLAYVLDGDNVRHGLNADLGFSREDRAENIRRIAAVAALFADAGLIAITAFISPYSADRDRARSTVGDERFVEVFVDAPLAVCEDRDPKGFYRKARSGEITEFTGVGAPYEEPEDPDVVVRTDRQGPSACVERLLRELRRQGIVPDRSTRP